MSPIKFPRANTPGCLPNPFLKAQLKFTLELGMSNELNSSQENTGKNSVCHFQT